MGTPCGEELSFRVLTSEPSVQWACRETKSQSREGCGGGEGSVIKLQFQILKKNLSTYQKLQIIFKK